MARFILFAISFFLVAWASTAADSSDEDEARRRQVKMKTTGQLKKIFKELDIDFEASMGKEELRELAFQEDAVERWLVLHPEKRPKKKTPPLFDGGIPNEKPDDMDPKVWEQLMGQMKNDFSHVQDPEKREMLEKLSASGIKFSGGADMTVEQLRGIVDMLDGKKMPGMEDL